MIQSSSTLKSALTYAICVPLALMLGYFLAQPGFDVEGVALIGGVLLVLSIPLMIHFHYPFLLLAWNMGAFVFFLPGRMGLWLVAILLSFFVSFTHRILDKNVRSVRVPELIWPLLSLAAIVVMTAELRGGIGLRSMGGESAGGRRYVELLVGILGYFALTARAIPRLKANRYIALFLLGGTLSAIGVFYGRVPGVLDFLFLFFPPIALDIDKSTFAAFRPLANASMALVAYLLARYGIRGMLASRHGRLLAVFGFAIFLALLSGARGAFVGLAMLLAVQFWVEGLLRTRLALYCALAFVAMAAVMAPFIQSLPLPVQRSLAVLPIKVDPAAEETAQASSEWRREIWRIAIPQIPEYLLLGKGYAISLEDYDMMTDASFSQYSAENRAATIAGDYHNGPLSVILPFGIWGVLAFAWILIAGGRVVWRNYRYGDPELRVINTYLLANFITSVITFVFVIGALQQGIAIFTGIFGFSVALNGGAAKAPAPAPFAPPTSRKKLKLENATVQPAVGMDRMGEG